MFKLLLFIGMVFCYIKCMTTEVMWIDWHMHRLYFFFLEKNAFNLTVLSELSKWSLWFINKRQCLWLLLCAYSMEIRIESIHKSINSGSWNIRLNITKKTHKTPIQNENITNIHNKKTKPRFCHIHLRLQLNIVRLNRL